jgi:hypothetical protein
MDDKAYSEPNANATGPDAPPGALIVAATNINGTDANKFSGCYFVINGTSWSLYSKNGTTPLATGTSNATGFNFDHDLVKGSTATKIVWTISSAVYTISNTNNTITKITGSWSNSDGSAEPVGVPPSGTFQASSGGAMDAESSSASASA